MQPRPAAPRASLEIAPPDQLLASRCFHSIIGAVQKAQGPGKALKA